MLRSNRHRWASFRQTGFSLIELMISIVVGLIVIVGVLGVFGSAIKSHSDNLRMTRLNQELRTVMNMMVRDIRRAGFNGDAQLALGPTAGNTNLFSDPAGTNLNLTPGTPASCVTFAYDSNGNGILEIGAGTTPDERYGYRLDAVADAVEMRQLGAACSATSNWVNITDENTIEIVALGANPALQFTVTNTPVDIDGSGTTTSTMTIRNVGIILSGRLKSDPSVARTLRETVRVSADLYLP